MAVFVSLCIVQKMVHDLTQRPLRRHCHSRLCSATSVLFEGKSHTTPALESRFSWYSNVQRCCITITLYPADSSDFGDGKNRALFSFFTKTLIVYQVDFPTYSNSCVLIVTSQSQGRSKDVRQVDDSSSGRKKKRKACSTRSN